MNMNLKLTGLEPVEVAGREREQAAQQLRADVTHDLAIPAGGSFGGGQRLRRRPGRPPGSPRRRGLGDAPR